MLRDRFGKANDAAGHKLQQLVDGIHIHKCTMIMIKVRDL